MYGRRRGTCQSRACVVVTACFHGPSKNSSQHPKYTTNGYGWQTPLNCIITYTRNSSVNAVLPVFYAITFYELQLFWYQVPLIHSVNKNIIPLENICLFLRSVLFCNGLVAEETLSAMCVNRMCYCDLPVFSQTCKLTTLRLTSGMANPSVCRLWHACTLLRGLNFSGIFLHHIVVWPSGNSSTKITKIVQGHHPQRGR